MVVGEEQKEALPFVVVFWLVNRNSNEWIVCLCALHYSFNQQGYGPVVQRNKQLLSVSGETWETK